MIDANGTMKRMLNVKQLVKQADRDALNAAKRTAYIQKITESVKLQLAVLFDRRAGDVADVLATLVAHFAIDAGMDIDAFAKEAKRFKDEVVASRKKAESPIIAQ